MAKRKKAPEAADSEPRLVAEEYTVLARRYRPQQFADIIGQEPIARALANALETRRVAHAYLFTGARGVGKTSTARILAKALNCVQGPTTKPCDVCEVCRSIATGEDVDVLEIDGASNRGIDEVRQIRQNVQYRPARCRYKIYIIDEVHMLTPAAFNALLKTLEEPPAHVKFIFATTEVQKIPVTILSRCQRFDFAGIGAGRIKEQLQQIVALEGLEADPEALELIARRAGGSMRDAESLLDQLLAFGGSAGAGRVTVDQVHHLLGTAHLDRVVALAAAIFERDAKKTLQLFGDACDQGLQLGELLDQLIEYWRDLLVVHLAGAEAQDVSVPARDREALAAQANSLSADSILAGLDVLSATKARLRASSHARVLLEMALVRLTRLEHLISLSQLAQQLSAPGNPAAPRPSSEPNRSAERRAPNRPAEASTQPSSERRVEQKRTEQDASPVVQGPTALTSASVSQVWRELLLQVGPILAGTLEKAEMPAIIGPKTLVLRFEQRYNRQQEHCQEPARVERIEEALRKLTGQAWDIRFESVSNDAAAAVAVAEADKSPSRYRRQRAEAMQEPLLKRASEALGAQIVQMDEDFGTTPSEPDASPTDAEES
jgi:DNA polymerase III subunit gamma/tau